MLKKINRYLGDRLALSLSTMVCFYLVAAAILCSLFFEQPKGIQAWLLFWVTVFFQGVALPLLGYVSKQSGDAQERLLRETHDTVMEELRIVKEELRLAKEERQVLRELTHDFNIREVLSIQSTETNQE